MNPADFAADLAAGLEELRGYAESMMTLVLAAYSPDGTTTNADGYEIPAYAPEGSTFGKVQADGSAKDSPTRYVNVGGVERPVVEGGLHIPITAPVPVASEQRGVGWEYEITAIGPQDDPALLGRRYLVVSAPVKSKATARRLDVIEIPAEV